MMFEKKKTSPFPHSAKLSLITIKEQLSLVLLFLSECFEVNSVKESRFVNSY